MSTATTPVGNGITAATNPVQKENDNAKVSTASPQAKGVASTRTTLASAAAGANQPNASTPKQPESSKKEEPTFFSKCKSFCKSWGNWVLSGLKSFFHLITFGAFKGESKDAAKPAADANKPADAKKGE